jgi:hypothetical protein
MSRSTAHRYMTTLVQLGFLEQPLGSSRKYTLGTNGYPIARAMLEWHPLCVNAHPHLHELRGQVSYTVTVAILERGTVRVLERLPGYRGHARLGLAIGAGSRLPAHCTALGKTLLANLPESESKANASRSQRPGTRDRGGKGASRRSRHKQVRYGAAEAGPARRARALVPAEERRQQPARPDRCRKGVGSVLRCGRQLPGQPRRRQAGAASQREAAPLQPRCVGERGRRHTDAPLTRFRRGRGAGAARRPRHVGLGGANGRPDGLRDQISPPTSQGRTTTGSSRAGHTCSNPTSDSGVMGATWPPR